MGGLVAEEHFFGETSSGVAGDLQSATDAAAQMVGSFGMAGSLISLEAVRGPGAPNIVAKVLSDEACRAELDRILETARQGVRSLLSEHAYLVEALRDALLDRDELIGGEISTALEEAEAARRATVVDLRSSAEVPTPAPSD